MVGLPVNTTLRLRGNHQELTSRVPEQIIVNPVALRMSMSAAICRARCTCGMWVPHIPEAFSIACGPLANKRNMVSTLMLLGLKP